MTVRSLPVTELGTAKDSWQGGCHRAGMFGIVFQLATVGKVLGESVCVGRCALAESLDFDFHSSTASFQPVSSG